MGKHIQRVRIGTLDDSTVTTVAGSGTWSSNQDWSWTWSSKPDSNVARGPIGPNTPQDRKNSLERLARMSNVSVENGTADPPMEQDSHARRATDDALVPRTSESSKESKESNIGAVKNPNKDEAERERLTDELAKIEKQLTRVRRKKTEKTDKLKEIGVSIETKEGDIGKLQRKYNANINEIEALTLEISKKKGGTATTSGSTKGQIDRKKPPDKTEDKTIEK